MMTDPNRLKQVQRLLQATNSRPRSTPWIGDFKQQIAAAIRKHDIEEMKANESYVVMPLRDTLTLFQKLTNAEYLKRVAALKNEPTTNSVEVKGKRPQRKDNKQHETVKVDKEKIKRRKIEADSEVSKTKQFLVSKELAELERLAGELDKTSDPESALSHFKYILKRNCELVSLTAGKGNNTSALKPVDMMLLNLILNKFKAHMYMLISHWLYQEYNHYLSQSSQTYFLRYEDILKEFCNLIEDKPADELVKSIEDWYNFVWTLPFLTKRVFQNIYAICVKDDPKNAIEPFSTVPLRLLKDLILSPAHKEAVNQKALKKLLRLSTHPKDLVKLKAIKFLSPELYSNPKYKDTIKEFAVESFAKLKEFKGIEDENTIKGQIGLLLRIAADEPEVLLGGMKHFAEVKENVKAVVLGQCKKMFEKCWKPNREGLKDVFEQAPAEGVQIVQTFVEVYRNTSFPGILKQALINLAKKISNYELLQPLVPQISQIEIDKNELIESAAEAKAPGKREFISGLFQNMAKSTNYWEKFRKVLTRLHGFDIAIVAQNVVEIIDMCIEKKEFFQLNDVVLPTLTELAKKEKVPILLPRTLLKVSYVYPTKVLECLKIIKIMLERRIWEVKDIWYGLTQYLKKYAHVVRENLSTFPVDSLKWIRDAIDTNK